MSDDLQKKAKELKNHAWLARFRKATYENRHHELSPECAHQIARYVDQFIDTVLTHPSTDTGAERITEEFVKSLGFRRDFPDENGHTLEWGKTAYGWEDSDPPPVPNLHVQVLVSFVDAVHVYLEEFDDGGKDSGTVELPQITTRRQLLDLLAALGVATNTNEGG